MSFRFRSSMNQEYPEATNTSIDTGNRFSARRTFTVTNNSQNSSNIHLHDQQDHISHQCSAPNRRSDSPTIDPFGQGHTNQQVFLLNRRTNISTTTPSSNGLSQDTRSFEQSLQQNNFQSQGQISFQLQHSLLVQTRLHNLTPSLLIQSTRRLAPFS